MFLKLSLIFIIKVQCVCEEFFIIKDGDEIQCNYSVQFVIECYKYKYLLIVLQIIKESERESKGFILNYFSDIFVNIGVLFF